MHGNEPNKIFISAHNSESSSKTQAALRESTGVYPIILTVTLCDERGGRETACFYIRESTVC